MRLIDADELKKALAKNITIWTFNISYDGILAETIDNAPTVERPQGEWNYIQAGMCVCPFCGAMPHKEYKNFCAKCGADMRGKEMTNAEKYQEVFGMAVDPSMCPTQNCDVCPVAARDDMGNVSCISACTYSWWSSEYKEIEK